MNIFKNNFYDLSELAANKAFELIKEFVIEFIDRAYQDKKISSNVFGEVAFQVNIFEAQKGYAKFPNLDLKENLINALLEIAQEREHTVKQIILDEVIETLPKLNSEHIDYLSFFYILVEYRNSEIFDLNTFENFIKNNLMPFSSENSSKTVYLTHLEHLSCIRQHIGLNQYKTIEELFLLHYPQLFSKGFTKDEFEQEFNVSSDDYDFMLASCLHNHESYQLVNNIAQKPSSEILQLLKKQISKDEAIQFVEGKMTNEELGLVDEKLSQDVKEKCRELLGKAKEYLEKLIVLDKEKLDKFKKSKLMTKEEVAECLISIDPRFKDFIEAWSAEDSLFKRMRLTPLGRAIAILNYNKKTQSQLSIVLE